MRDGTEGKAGRRHTHSEGAADGRIGKDSLSSSSSSSGSNRAGARTPPARHVQLLANEAYLDGGEDADVTALCPGWLYLTMLREPVARVVSHMQQAGVRGTNPDLSKEEYAALPFRERIAARPAIANNYVQRMLLGAAAFHAPLGALDGDPARLRHAATLLLSLHVVVLLEQKAAAAGLLRHMLGWEGANLDASAGRVDRRRVHAPQLDEATRADIERHNSNDKILHALGNIAMALDEAVFVFRDARGQPSADSLWPCT
jgi:hypothetical protein